MPPDARYVPTATAAQIAGVNVRTVRRWASAGRVPAMSRAHRLLVDLDAVRRLATAGTDDEGMPGTIPDDPAGAPDSRDTGPGVEALIDYLRDKDDVIDRLHRENLELSGRLGFFQAKVQTLEEQVRLLSAPVRVANEPVGNSEAPASTPPTTTPAPGAPDAASQPPLRRPWWAFWRPNRPVAAQG